MEDIADAAARKNPRDKFKIRRDWELVRIETETLVNLSSQKHARMRWHNSMPDAGGAKPPGAISPDQPLWLPRIEECHIRKNRFGAALREGGAYINQDAFMRIVIVRIQNRDHVSRSPANALVHGIVNAAVG